MATYVRIYVCTTGYSFTLQKHVYYFFRDPCFVNSFPKQIGRISSADCCYRCTLVVIVAVYCVLTVNRKKQKKKVSRLNVFFFSYQIKPAHEEQASCQRALTPWSCTRVPLPEAPTHPPFCGVLSPIFHARRVQQFLPSNKIQPMTQARRGRCVFSVRGDNKKNKFCVCNCQSVLE